MLRFFDPTARNWHQLQNVPERSYACGYCGDKVASNRGYRIGDRSDGTGPAVGGVYICPGCQAPTFVDCAGNNRPEAIPGNNVSNVPDDVNTLYTEARLAVGRGAPTAAVLTCRKILMHIGVEKEAEKGKPFVYYIEHLASKGFIPLNGKGWVEHIRRTSNEANHEINVMSNEQAIKLVLFVEMMLRFIYELPSMVAVQTVTVSPPQS